jgi:tyrosinase
VASKAISRKLLFLLSSELNLVKEKNRGYDQADHPRRYWDWTLDWEDITKASVWDDELGFGGDGNTSDPTTSINGSCVTTGPFARLQVPVVKINSHPHCLSRKFARGEDLIRFVGKAIRPAAIEDLLRLSDYMAFNLGLEYNAHRSIPRGVLGDFSGYTARAGLSPSPFPTKILSLCSL